MISIMNIFFVNNYLSFIFWIFVQWPTIPNYIIESDRLLKHIESYEK